MASQIKPGEMPPFPKEKTVTSGKNREDFWSNLRKKLKKRFDVAGIRSCEIKLTQCWGADALGFAHTKKRADLIDQEDWERVVLGCGACHTSVEGMKKADMEDFLETIIQQREVQP